MTDTVNVRELRRNDVIQDPYVPDSLLKVVDVRTAREGVYVTVVQDQRYQRVQQTLRFASADTVVRVAQNSPPVIIRP